jgi:hypothetical protein
MYKPGKPRPGFPRPYKSPRIELDHHEKSWQDLPASQVRKGDMIAGRGLVHEAAHDRNGHVMITAGENGPSLHLLDETMKVFR